MQHLRLLPIDVDTYVAEKYHRRIRPPPNCLNCGNNKPPRLLGYYERYLTRLGKGVYRIKIRRFRCRVCRKTISVLPLFAQPYRLVQTRTIERFFMGAPYDVNAIRWMGTLSCYRRRFLQWFPEIQRVLGVPGRAPPDEEELREWWRRLFREYGNLGSATLSFVSIFQITLFGRYRCHRPNPPTN